MQKVCVGLTEDAMERERQRKVRLATRLRELRRLDRLEQMQKNEDFMCWLATRGFGEMPSDETLARFKGELRVANERLRQSLRYKERKAEREWQRADAAQLPSATALGAGVELATLQDAAGTAPAPAPVQAPAPVPRSAPPVLVAAADRVLPPTPAPAEIAEPEAIATAAPTVPATSATPESAAIAEGWLSDAVAQRRWPGNDGPGNDGSGNDELGADELGDNVLCDNGRGSCDSGFDRALSDADSGAGRADADEDMGLSTAADEDMGRDRTGGDDAGCAGAGAADAGVAGAEIAIPAAAERRQAAGLGTVPVPVPSACPFTEGSRVMLQTGGPSRKGKKAFGVVACVRMSDSRCLRYDIGVSLGDTLEWHSPEALTLAPERHFMSLRRGSPVAMRMAREERELAARTAANDADLRAIEAVLHKMERVWAMLPPGRVVPARVRAAAERLFSEQRSNSCRRSSRPYVLASDAKALELTAEEVEAGETGESVDAVLFRGASLEEAQAEGAPFKLRSVLLKVSVPPKVLQAAEATIPSELTPRADDDIDSLTRRAGQAPQKLDLTRTRTRTRTQTRTRTPTPEPELLHPNPNPNPNPTLIRFGSSTKLRSTTRTRIGTGTHATGSLSSTHARVRNSRCAALDRCTTAHQRRTTTATIALNPPFRLPAPPCPSSLANAGSDGRQAHLRGRRRRG